MQVKTIDKQEVKKSLKGCPKIVRDYVKSLEQVYEASRETNRLVMTKLKEHARKMD